jgi:ArsR family transcriptional regulator, arsenate/arsenite/antimonite-responsive transcriptional repressor
MVRSPLSVATEILKAAGHPARIRILAMLRPGGLYVSQVTAALELAVSTVSAHLADLKRAGLVAERKDGRFVFYRLAEDSGADLLLQCVMGRVSNDPLVVADARLARRLRKIPVETLCRGGVDLRRLRQKRRAKARGGRAAR